MKNSLGSFIQHNSLGGDFLQSFEWAKFQESVGRKTYNISSNDFYASIIEHKLPMVGKYFYVPRGPILCHPEFISGSKKMLKQVQHDKIKKLVNLARENKAGWIRIEPASGEILENIKDDTSYKITKAPHDMQPREILVMDITKTEEELLAEMKQKTRYNIRLAEKKNVVIKKVSRLDSGSEAGMTIYIDEFLRLTKIMAKRQGIQVHPDNYYRKMLEVIPGDIIKLYAAEYGEEIIAANIVVFYGDTCTYLHGASDEKYQNVMAPYLLQWRQIQDAKAAGCARYDFGGISTNYESSTNIRITNKWSGITRFKTGFSPNIKPVVFPGCYDIIIGPVKYWTYRTVQKLKNYL